jgi:hypothetical protein
MLLAAAVASTWMSPGAHAFERCDKLFANADELRDFVVEASVRYGPKKYFDAARSIRIDIDEKSGKLFPLADLDSGGQPVIVYPAAFPPVLCRMVLATYVDLDGHAQNSPPEAARAAAKCVLSGKPRAVCLKDEARILERLYRDRFAALSEQKQRMAYEIAYDALRQIGRHEYAHHLLKHWDRVGSGGMARIDAEFEADFYAVFEGIQAGEIPSAMYYFFHVVEDVEELSQPVRSTDPGYESSACRATNVNDVTGLFGATAMTLVDIAAGEHSITAPPETELSRLARELTSGAAPKPSPDNCGRLKESVLRDAYGELASLAALMAEHAALFARGADGEMSSAAFATPEGFALIERLQERVHGFKQIKGLAARILSILVQNVGLAGAEAKLSRKLDADVDSIADDILSDDYGRLLKVRGLRVLREPDLSPAQRIDTAEALFKAAATFSPSLTEAWLNLSLIAFARGDCPKAADLADKGVLTTSDKQSHDQAASFRDRLRGLSDPKRCAEEGAELAERLVQ